MQQAQYLADLLVTLATEKHTGWKISNSLIKTDLPLPDGFFTLEIAPDVNEYSVTIFQPGIVRTAVVSQRSLKMSLAKINGTSAYRATNFLWENATKPKPQTFDPYDL